VLLVVVVLVAAVAVADGLTGRAGSSILPAHITQVSGEKVAASDAESSAWFCVGGGSTGGGALATLTLTNTTARAVNGMVTVVPAGGRASTIRVSVPAYRQMSVVPAQVAVGSWVAATVVFDGGGVGVSETIAGPLGWSMAPCASSASSKWYFAHGSTASGAILSLSLYNPSGADAVADVTLDSASAGQVQPPAYQGIAVPAGSLVVENIGDHLLNDPSVATEVTTSSGTVVAAELQLTLNAGSGGSSLLLGAGPGASEWGFPQNIDLPGGHTVFHVFNPSDREALVSANVSVAEGAGETGTMSMHVPPHSVADLVANNEPRIPVGIAYALEFAAAGGVGIVVDREVVSPVGSPAPQVGEVQGFPGSAVRVLIPAVIPPGVGASYLAVSDLSSRPVSVTVENVHGEPLAGLDRRLVSPGRSLLTIPAPASPIGAVPLLVTSSGPVAVELDGAPAGTAGAVVVPALVVG
jgi:hypothetical protein